MTQVISATSTRFGRMSPTAAMLAALLHLLTALALWWVSPLSHRAAEIQERAIDVTIEQPSPAPPAPETRSAPPPAVAKPPPPQKAAPAPLGLPPRSPTTAETPKQAAPKTEEAHPLPRSQPGQQPGLPEPSKDQQQPQQALAPQERAPPSPSLERSLPPLEAPPPPLTSKDFPTPPASRRPPTRAAPATPLEQLRPSPLSTLPQSRPSDESHTTAPSTTFVNPAERYNQTRAIEQYLWSVATKISQYRYHSNQANEQGTVVLHMVIARDGRLLDVSIARSSGVLNLDRGLIEAARAAAPYAPLPDAVGGARLAFTLPFASVYRPR